MLRYLAAFGPASVADVRTWSGLTGLRAVVERLRPDLETFRDARGTELFDVPGGARPDPATPAPPRFLAEYDNVTLSHADRSRVLAGLGPGLPIPRGRSVGTLLVDGFYRANWRTDRHAGAVTLTIDRFARRPGDPSAVADEIAAEGERMLAFLEPDAVARHVRFDPEP